MVSINNDSGVRKVQEEETLRSQEYVSSVGECSCVNGNHKNKRMNGKVKRFLKPQSYYDTCCTDIPVLVIWTSAALSAGILSCAS